MRDIERYCCRFRSSRLEVVRGNCRSVDKAYSCEIQSDLIYIRNYIL